MSAIEDLSRAGFDRVLRLDLGGVVAFLVLHAEIASRTFGGIRIQPYASEAEALDDACELAQAMSRKVVLAGIVGGGAKTVVIEPAPERRRQALQRLAEIVESLDGRYFCGGDLGFGAEDQKVVSAGTRYVACGDLGRHSARTVLDSMRAVADPRRVAVQGLGAIGRPVAETLRADGVEVIASDLLPVDGFDSVAPDRIYDVDCDVFSPCAAGHVLDADTVERLRCRVVCGGANNPFASTADADRLHRRGIVYVPDVIANVGATIQGASTSLGEEDLIEERFAAIPALARETTERARVEGISPDRVARRLAEERIAELRAVG